MDSFSVIETSEWKLEITQLDPTIEWQLFLNCNGKWITTIPNSYVKIKTLEEVVRALLTEKFPVGKKRFMPAY